MNECGDHQQWASPLFSLNTSQLGSNFTLLGAVKYSFFPINCELDATLIDQMNPKFELYSSPNSKGK